MRICLSSPAVGKTIESPNTNGGAWPAGTFVPGRVLTLSTTSLVWVRSHESSAGLSWIWASDSISSAASYSPEAAALVALASMSPSTLKPQFGRIIGSQAAISIQ